MPGSSCWRPRRQRLSPARPPCQPRRPMHCGARAGGRAARAGGAAGRADGAMAGPASGGAPLQLRAPCPSETPSHLLRRAGPASPRATAGSGDVRISSSVFSLMLPTATLMFSGFSLFFTPELSSHTLGPRVRTSRMGLPHAGPCVPRPRGFPPPCSAPVVLRTKRPVVNRVTGGNGSWLPDFGSEAGPAAGRASILASVSAGSLAGLGGVGPGSWQGCRLT